MTNDKGLWLNEIPFCIGARPTPHNPRPLPDFYPFGLVLNEHVGRLDMQGSPDLDALLKKAYELGNQIGTPADHSDLGNPYVADFVGYLKKHIFQAGRVLEIGAGVGYLSRVLADGGWRVDSLEPGKGYAACWDDYGINVINDFFPSANAKGPYDLIIFYNVLEHVKDTRTFLSLVREHLHPDGRIALAVPDCTCEIATGDPSMLLHEHWHYFTDTSLHRTLSDGGFTAKIESATYGRSLYALAAPGETVSVPAVCNAERTLLEQYSARAAAAIATFNRNIKRHLKCGTVGIFCPARVLNLLNRSCRVRFFDDASDLRGKFYPPFASRIESRQELFANPPDLLLIMSRTFGRKLKNELSNHLSRTNIVTVDEFLK